MKDIKPYGLVTAIGSLAHENQDEAIDFILEHLQEVPHWPQLPGLGKDEGFVEQYLSPLLESNLLKVEKSTSFVDDDNDWLDKVTEYYNMVLNAESGNKDLLERFAFPYNSAQGFYSFCARMSDNPSDRFKFLKGQISGPVTIGWQVKDAAGRLSFYNDTMRELLVKTLALQARWQVNKMKSLGYPVIIFVDDPGLYGFGQSSSVGMSRNHVVDSLAEIFQAIQAEGGLAGVHACAGVDWSVVMDSKPDIINVDMYDYFASLLVYATNLEEFLLAGGTLAWGIVPTSEDIDKETVESLWHKILEQCLSLEKRGVSQGLLRKQWMLTPACGAGTRPIKRAEKMYSFLNKMAGGKEGVLF